MLCRALFQDSTPYVGEVCSLRTSYTQYFSENILRFYFSFVLPQSWERMDWNTANFTPDITPLILAAHKNNYEIIKILLDRGATLPMPHDIR